MNEMLKTNKNSNKSKLNNENINNINHISKSDMLIRTK